MAKKNVVELVCDRCDRTEHVGPEKYNELPDFKVVFGPEGPDGQEIQIQFDDLCSSCTKTVRNLIEQAVKKISWKRGKGEEELEAKKEGAGE